MVESIKGYIIKYFHFITQKKGYIIKFFITLFLSGLTYYLSTVIPPPRRSRWYSREYLIDFIFTDPKLYLFTTLVSLVTLIDLIFFALSIVVVSGNHFFDHDTELSKIGKMFYKLISVLGLIVIVFTFLNQIAYFSFIILSTVALLILVIAIIAIKESKKRHP